MHRIGSHPPPPLPASPLQAAARAPKTPDTVRLAGRTMLDPFLDLAETYGGSDRIRRRTEPDRSRDRRAPPGAERQPKPAAFSGEIENLFAAALASKE